MYFPEPFLVPVANGDSLKGILVFVNLGLMLMFCPSGKGDNNWDDKEHFSLSLTKSKHW